MTVYSINDLHIGIKIIFNNLPYIVESSEFIKPGKGQAFTRVKMRCLLNNLIIDKIFKATFCIKKANIKEINLSYLYKDDQFYYFIHSKNFNQYQVNNKIINSNLARWLLPNIIYTLIFWNKNPIQVIPPNFVNIKIIDTSPSFKGETIGKNNKIALLSTGIKIKVPSFLKIGEIIKVDTRSGEYISRIK